MTIRKQWCLMASMLPLVLGGCLFVAQTSLTSKTAVLEIHTGYEGATGWYRGYCSQHGDPSVEEPDGLLIATGPEVSSEILPFDVWNNLDDDPSNDAIPTTNTNGDLFYRIEHNKVLPDHCWRLVQQNGVAIWESYIQSAATYFPEAGGIATTFDRVVRVTAAF